MQEEEENLPAQVEQKAFVDDESGDGDDESGGHDGGCRWRHAV